MKSVLCRHERKLNGRKKCYENAKISEG